MVATYKRESESATEKQVNIAVVQMDAKPAPTAERLERAERLVIDAAQEGSQLIVLPELFNTGYAYSNESHTRAETIEGQTAKWMQGISARFNIHLAGALMLLDEGEAYCSLLLFAPDGRMWRYDKNYPWGWEHGYFRKSRLKPKVTVAETDLGNIGMLICWDVSHLKLWELYAGHIDLMVISCCVVDPGVATYHFPNGTTITADDMGPSVASIKETAPKAFGDMMNQQTAWLGVPTVNATACGHIQTPIPRGRHTLLGYSFGAPWLLKHFRLANRIRMSCEVVHECKVVDDNGEVVARLTKEEGEAFTMAEVELKTLRSMPQGSQPASLVLRFAYFVSDVFLPTISKSVYKTGKRLRMED